MPYDFHHRSRDPWEGRRQSERATATQARVLDAALAVFSERGYERARIEEIRERSGVSVGSIYHHFGGKEQIAAALHVEALRDYHQGALAELRREQPAEKAVKGLVRHHLRWVEANPERAAFLFAPRSPELRLASERPVRELHRQLLAVVADWRERHEGELSPMSADVFYAVATGPAQEISRHQLAGTTDTPLRRLERELGDAAWNAVRGDRSA